MTTANILFGFAIATLYGTLFHFWRGGKFSRIIFFILFSWTGFWAGHGFASVLGISFARMGTLNLGIATIGALLALALGYWLSMGSLQDQ